jgi:DNA-binding MarR family transcriptional regulator
VNLDLQHHLPFQLAVLSNYVKQSTSDRLAKNHGMSGRDWRVLAIIGMHQPVTPASIAEVTGMDRVTVTRSIQQLEAKQLVSKSKNQVDGRSVLVRLTKQGEAHWRPMMQAMQQQGEAYRRLLTPGEFALLLELIERLQNYARKELITHETNG